MARQTPTESPLPIDLATAARLPAPEVLARLDGSPAGLTSAQAAERLRRYGPNLLHEHRVTAAGVLLRQLRNPLLVLLLAAATVSAATGSPADAGIIGAIVLLSVGLGFVNEYRSEQAVAALHERIHHQAMIQRDGVLRAIDVAQVVPGDVVTLRVGDVVPADLRLLTVTRLACDEAVLTGESAPAEKSAEPAGSAASDVALASCAFMGTVVHAGTATGVAVATGAGTAFGRIAVGLEAPLPMTAFLRGLASFSRLLLVVAAVLTSAVFVINVVLHRPVIDALLFSLAIAIGITPQLLPAIVSVSLAAGSRQLARKQVVVKRLVTIEDLGNIRVLFTDKTGTLTQGSIAFTAALDEGGRPDPRPLELALVCNEAVRSPSGPAGGNELDRALWLAEPAAELAGSVERYHRIGILPFDHERQLVSVAVDTPAGDRLLVTKGAPEAVLARCVDPPSSASPTLERLFADGARVIAVATRSAPTLEAPTPADERDLTLAGFLTFADPPKASAGAAVATLRRLGVDVKIVTGDNGTVAAKVCRDIGLEVTGQLTGADLDALSDADLRAAIPRTTVFARIGPEQKSRIIHVAREGQTDVAFLGDGVNDAVALHAADVGISVDTATDVAKDAADIVLLANDLGVLADGVMEGRRIFGNTLKYVLMATSSNFGNMFSAAGASLFLSYLPMLPSQVLLNNLLYDVGQLSIPTDRVDPEDVERPAAWDIRFVRRFMIAFGPISSIFDFTTFFVMLRLLHAGQSEFRTGWFVESLATQTLVIYLIRTRRIPFFRSRPSRPMLVTPLAAALIGVALPLTPLAHALGFQPLPLRFFAALVAMVLIYLTLVEIAKWRFYATYRPAEEHPETRRRRKAAHRQRRRALRFFHRVGPRPRAAR